MKISVRKKGERLLVAPAEYLDRPAFGRYLGACKKAGARFSKQDEGQLIDQGRLGLLAEHLVGGGFEIEGDDHVIGLMQRVNAQRERANDAIGDTLHQKEVALAERGLKLYEFQRGGVPYLMAHDRALLADEMGLGKTVQALVALGEADPVVVIAPAAVKGVWKREAARWCPQYKVTVLSGRNSFRWPDAGEIVILNYDILPKHEDKTVGRYKQPVMAAGLAQAAPVGCVLIPDECHALKNRTALRTRRFAAMSKVVRGKRGKVWLLTGTPLLNRPPELWQVLSAADLARDAFGSWPNFTELCGGSRGKFGYEWGGRIDPSVPDLLQRVSLQRRRSVVLPDLPDKTYKDVVVNGMSAELRRECDELIRLLLGEGIDLEDANEQVDMTRVERIGFKKISKIRSALATHKIPSMLEIVETYEEAEEPLLVFSAHRAPIDTLGKRKGWVTITGSVANERRTEIEDEFQRGTLKGVACTIKAGGVGLTLTHAAHVLFVDLDWTPALNQQAEDRVCRIGQTRGCVITRLAADHTLDIRINELLAEKAALIAATMTASARTEVTGDDLEPNAPLSVTRESIDGCDRDEDEDDQPTPAPPSNGYKKKREPENDLERWAGDGLATVAELDPDHASAINNVGFSKFDGKFGHSLATQYKRSGKMTDKQWAAAVRLATKYRRQIGDPPSKQQTMEDA
jgi:SNF2 family DNA or RNA helicase